MNNEVKQQRLARAKELLRLVRHVPIATTNDDGSPHLSPVFMAFDAELNGFWASHPQTQHSQNIARDGRAFIVLFETTPGQGGGLYIQALAEVFEHDSPEFTHAYQTLKAAKDRTGAPLADPEAYLLPEGQRLYCVTPVKLWVNASEKDSSGAIIRDRRYEITLKDLL